MLQVLNEPSCTAALQKCVPRPYSNKQSSSCSDHCHFVVYFGLTLFQYFTGHIFLSACTLWFSAAFCKHWGIWNLLFSFYRILVKQQKHKETQRSCSYIMQIFLLPIFSGKSLKTSSALPSLHSAKPRLFFHMPIFLILPVLQYWEILDDQISSSVSLKVKGSKLCFCHLIRELL